MLLGELLGLPGRPRRHSNLRPLPEGQRLLHRFAGRPAHPATWGLPLHRVDELIRVLLQDLPHLQALPHGRFNVLDVILGAAPLDGLEPPPSLDGREERRRRQRAPPENFVDEVAQLICGVGDLPFDAPAAVLVVVLQQPVRVARAVGLALVLPVDHAVGVQQRRRVHGLGKLCKVDSTVTVGVGNLKPFSDGRAADAPIEDLAHRAPHLGDAEAALLVGVEDGKSSLKALRLEQRSPVHFPILVHLCAEQAARGEVVLSRDGLDRCCQRLGKAVALLDATVFLFGFALPYGEHSDQRPRAIRGPKHPNPPTSSGLRLALKEASDGALGHHSSPRVSLVHGRPQGFVALLG
mmetsp:Transcript_16511/g.62788  ORF Transcript_16511/g.62788 Transcript_16511/m.62788 type:complete len:351 (+) Transcript_16511:810-1862(+)